jgi:apolipoprotein N-acyltransferase
MRAARARDEAPRMLDVAAVQPGAIPRGSDAELDAWQRERLVAPTRAAAARGAVLVLWPESTSFVDVVPPDGERAGSNGSGARLCRGIDWLAPAPLPLAPETRLLLGGCVAAGPHRGLAAGVLIDERGAFLGYHEKVRLVPGGEHQPFLGWLPQSLSQALQRGLAAVIGVAPHLQPGRLRPPLAVAEGIAVGTLLCFDNAFPDVARAYVEAGANLLAVLSNEAWYRGGAELDQMEAMTVLRALETGAAVVRCTVDGVTVAIDGDGHVLGRLPRGEPGVLRVRVPIPARATGTLAPIAPWIGLLCALSLALAVAQALTTWVRLRRPFGRNDLPAAADLPVDGA